jgi:hypothetical protein
VHDAESEELSDEAAETLVETVAELAKETRDRPESFDPAVPGILDVLSSFAKQGVEGTKIASLALLRSICNFFSGIGNYVVNFAKECGEKTKAIASGGVALSLVAAAQELIAVFSDKLVTLANSSPDVFSWLHSLMSFFRTLPPMV